MTSINILVTVLVFFLMEGVTWMTHKYVMHGFLWYLHKDHHQPSPSRFWEKNDLFFVIFALPSIGLFYWGAQDVLRLPFFIGLGIFLYGLAYFLVHEVIIHRRFRWFDKIQSPYLKALRKAHKIHHKHLGREDGECFGMLFVPWKYFQYYFKQ